MRRFLDWTATQAAGGGSQPSASQTNPVSPSNPTRRSSQQHSPLSRSSTTLTANQQHQHPHHQHHHQQPHAQSLYSQNPTKDLELHHLTKLLHEIKYYQASSSPLVTASASQNQREFVDKVNKTLPLFLSVFGGHLVHSDEGSQVFTLNEGSCLSSLSDDWSHSDPTSHTSKPSSPLPPAKSPQMEKFPDLLPFAFTVARLFVSEVRQRASDKHAEDASLAILQFIRAKSSPINTTTSSAAATTFISSQDKTNDDNVVEVQPQTSSRPINLQAEDDAGHGWKLLLSLNTLVNSQNPQIIQLLCDASLPSTLIKCLYLFFDLPATIKLPSASNKYDLEVNKQDSTNASEKGSSATETTIYTPELTSGLLIKAFTQLLVQLCSYQSAIDELIKKDDLRLLIGIASSQCLSHNKGWRRTASQALLAISRNMRDNFIYLEQNICLQVYVENLYRINSLGLSSIEDFIDMVKILLEFLYNIDVNNRNQTRKIVPLIEQFKSSRILELIEELLFRIDDSILQEINQVASSTGTGVDPLACPTSQQPSVSSEIGVYIDDYRRHGRRLIHSLVTMAKIYYNQETLNRNTTLKPLTMSRFEMLDQFKMPRPSARDCILNIEAIRLFKMAWSKCKDTHIIEAILDATISLFNDDKYNYFIFESQQLLVYYMTSSNFNQFPLRIKQKFFKFLEFIIIETNYIPCLELGTIATIIKAKSASDLDHALALRTLIACLRFNSKFGDIFREIGLLEVITDLLIATMHDQNLGQHQDKLEVLYLLLEASQYLLAGPNNLNCTQFNESGAARHVFNCLSKPKFFHLFVPLHSSSSDDGGATNNVSRNSTPTPTAFGKSRHVYTVVPLGNQHHHHHHQSHWPDTRAQCKPSIKQMHKAAFTIIRQLILSSAGDEHLANLLGLLARNLDDIISLQLQDENVDMKQANPDLTLVLSQEVNLKIYILKSLMIILKDSHRCRTLFRKVGGFIYIVSSLVALERSLPPHDQNPNEREAECYQRWRSINTRRIWRLIKSSLMTIVIAMRSEPSNLRVFSEDVMDKFTNAIRELGCFNPKQMTLLECVGKIPPRTDNFDSFKSIFLSPPARDFSTVTNDNLKPNEACCQLFRFLYDMSLDMADGSTELESQLNEESSHIFKGHQQHHQHDSTKSISFDQGAGSNYNESGIFKRRSQLQKAAARPPSLDLNSCSAEPAILTFPCIILSILDLVPSCPNEDLMIFVCMIVKSLFKHERNRQMLCEAGLIGKLLDRKWSIALTNKNHFLHTLSEFMFEELTRQAIKPQELRAFLRLGDPLRCKNLDEIRIDFDDMNDKDDSGKQSHDRQMVNSSKLNERRNEKISTDRIETLVAMMSSDRSKQQPPFVEFDMNTDGCSSIFMPSIAPVNAKSLPPNSSAFLNSTLDVHTNEKNGILGGVGSLERQFPPMAGLTFSTWICVEKFPARSSDASHNIRLLTIYRGSAATGKEYSCFKIQISALDRALTISTQETLLFDNENRADSQQDPDSYLRIWTPETLVEGKWHHVAITMNRSSAKQSTMNVFIDGSPMHSQRICYISSHVGSPNSGPLGAGSIGIGACSPAAFVNAFIGSLPQYRQQLKTRWKQGPCHLIEESLSANLISVIYLLGPNYIGNFQSSTKLSELAKFKLTKFDIKYQKETNQHHHQQLTHQQSASVNQSPRHGIPLSRVSSTGLTGHIQQSSSIHTTSSTNFHIPEDRVLVNLDARSTSLMTLPRMRRIYTRFDCRQVSRVLGLAMHENSTPILLLHNTGVHLNGPSRSIGAITIGQDHVRCFIPSPTEQTLFNIGGSYVLLGLVAQSQSAKAFYTSLRAFVSALTNNPKLMAQMDSINGYQILTVLFWKKIHLLSPEILKLIFALTTNHTKKPAHIIAGNSSSLNVPSIQQVGALRDLICECFDLWLKIDMINLVLEFIHNLISSSDHHGQQTSDSIGTICSVATGSSNGSVRSRNLKCLRDMDLLPRMLRLLPRDPQQHELGLDASHDQCDSSKSISQSFDVKAVYLIKQTVFELLNRTPRQSDILYFGQYLASLLPICNTNERSAKTISLRNVLLKSLLQMMTKNKQKEVNGAMQGELVRILGFDWFMLFFSGSHLDDETITLGFLNMMIVLSNDDLYLNFKNKTTPNGGWLKEPTFPTIDGKFNIQLLGVNVGVFFGLSGKRRSMCQEVLNAPNFFLLSQCLGNLVEQPRIYLMIFQTMIGRFETLDSNVLDTISAFDKLTLDILCDSLIGETHHKRRHTLSGVQFKCLELSVNLVYMLKDIMSQYQPGDKLTEDNGGKREKPVPSSGEQYECFPNDIIRFFMYLYNNNLEFQTFCRRSEELIDALSETLMQAANTESGILNSSSSESHPHQSNGAEGSMRQMTSHPASKEVLELSRLIILDRMTEVPETGPLGGPEQLAPFERFLESLADCREAQGELVDMLLRQILLMIDSTARHNSIKTIGSSENSLQFQLLLINSISVSQIITDKIWSRELYKDNLSRISTIIDHQLCLAEQIFKFNELLPKHNPPHAFIMQRLMNKLILFALSRPMQHMSDKITMLDLLKKIHDNRTIIILNHMHSQQSAEFFVCLTYCLMKIIEDNLITPTKRSGLAASHQTFDQSPLQQHSASLIERQYGHPLNRSHDDIPSSSALMLVSVARKVWDAIYQSKKGILSEALDVSLSLPAFTLDTSLDLMQLKPDIAETCEKYWSALVEAERRPRRKLLTTKQGGSSSSEHASPGTAASAAVNMLSGRLTRVVNAASFVSRVVGATAGTVASNVNLAGEKLTQSRGGRRELAQRSPSDLGSPSFSAGSSSSNNNSGQLSTSGQSNQSQGSFGNQVESFRYHNLSRNQIQEANHSHIAIIEDYIESQHSQKNHKLALHKYLCEEWLDIEYEVLLRERALFGPDYGTQLDKWCLDMTEGPRRMRKKMVNNTRQFYENYDYNPEQYNPSNKSLRYRPPMSYDSRSYYLKTANLHGHLLDVSEEDEKVEVEIQVAAAAPVIASPEKDCSLEKVRGDDDSKPTNDKIELNPQVIETPVMINVNSPSPTSKSARDIHSSIESISSLSQANNNNRSPRASPSSPRPPTECDPDDGDSTSFVDFSPEIEAETNSARDSENIDSLTVLRLLEKNERISHMFRCSRVQGLDTYEGLLLFGREHFYLIDGFTLMKTREIKDIDSLQPDAHDPIIPNTTPNILAHSKKTCAKFSFDSVVEVHKRRYLLQPIALEVFSSDGRNTLIVFPRNIRNKVFSRITTVATQLTNNAHESLAGQRSNVSVESGSGLLSNLIGETSVTQRWVRGELSNFQYLMNLNTIAGRSYNDLMQYPIFPWILADYTSELLDLTKPSTFRDLSRPIGAQTSDRLEQFKRRYAEWDDTETPPYHYGTFYSSAMIVASYMVRMEPFSQHFLRLQGGHFDLADRMFHSIGDSWQSASKHNMADIKELIPEFFYLPEFLINENKYDLGIKQNGMKLDNVKLPPWAKNDACEFIRLHRCALESDYVSAHLHEWIDLIFGYKQQGQAAVEAVNVFHHLFYEGNVDIYNTDIDPIKKNAIIGFINNFGQVPKQIFKKPHPVRKAASTSTSVSMPLTPMLPSLSGSSTSGGSAASQRVLTHHPQLLKLSNTQFKDLRGPVGQIVQVDKNIVAVEQNKLLIPPEYCRYIAWGHADRSVRLGLYDSEKPIFVWEGSDNLAPNEILCCTIPNSRTMITAGTESLITVWKIEKMRSFAPMLNLYGHVEPVTCLASSQAYSIIVSGSRDRTAIIWDLNRFTFVRQLGSGPPEELIHQGPVSAISINDSTGDIATCASSWLYVWTINGQLLAQVDSFSVTIQQSLGIGSSMSSNLSQLHILSVCFSQYSEWDSDEVIVTGASDGSVALWSLRFYQCPMSKAEIEVAEEERKELAKIEEADRESVNRQQEEHAATRNKRAAQEVHNGSEATAVAAQQKEAHGDDGVDVVGTDQGEAGVQADSEAPLVTTYAGSAYTGPISESIAIGGRKRTDTINSDWVKLSTSSASTTDTIPIFRTPTSPANGAGSGYDTPSCDFLASGESFCTGDGGSVNFPLEQPPPLLHASNQQQHQPTCSSTTPIPEISELSVASAATSNKEERNIYEGPSSGDTQQPPPPPSPSSPAHAGVQQAVDQRASIGNLPATTPVGDEPDGQSVNKTTSPFLLPNDPSMLKFSKSDTSLVDSFVLLGDAPSGASGGPLYNQPTGSPGRTRPQSSAGTHSPASSVTTGDQKSRKKLITAPNNRRDGERAQLKSCSVKLQANHCWRRELYLRMLIPRRQAKIMPAPVTSLAIAKDHKTLYVGDANGRVSSWTTI